MPKLISILYLLSLAFQGPTQVDFPDPIRDIILNVSLLQDNPGLLAADSIGIIVKAGKETDYKLSAQDKIITCGQLRSGNNMLLLTWPGMFAKTQTLPFMLELKVGTQVLQKTILITVSVTDSREQAGVPWQTPSGEFTIQMYMAGQQVGFRKKTMTELVKLTTGTVSAVEDPALRGSAIRRAPSSQSISILGLAMGIAKYLAEKKLAAAKETTTLDGQKRKISVALSKSDKYGEKRTVQAVIELQTK